MELDFIITCILVFLIHLPPVVTFSPSLESSCICRILKVSKDQQENVFLPACCWPRLGRRSFSAGARSSSPSRPDHHLPLAMQAPPCTASWMSMWSSAIPEMCNEWSLTTGVPAEDLLLSHQSCDDPALLVVSARRLAGRGGVQGTPPT